MIKASEGGGGKGIRKAANIEDFPTQFRQVFFLPSSLIINDLKYTSCTKMNYIFLTCIKKN